MSQIGPYGPGNPPPPPPGPPPGASNRDRARKSSHIPEQLQAPKLERPYSKLNPKQRRARNLERDQARDAAARQSRSPFRAQAEVDQADVTDYRIKRVQHDSRQPLNEARQTTPSQELDETHGRLSPGPQPQHLSSEERYQSYSNSNPFPGPASRDNRHADRSWLPQPGNAEHTRQVSQGRTDWDNASRASADRPDGYGAGEGHRTQSTGLALATTGSTYLAFKMEDEVDWDDDDLEAAAESTQPQSEPNHRGKKPQQAAYKDAMRNKHQGKKRAFSQSGEEQPPSDRPWQNKAHKTKHPKLSPAWGGTNQGQRQPNERFPVQSPFGQSNQPAQHNRAPNPGPDVSSFQGRRTQPRTYEQSLLEPDPALVEQGLPVPETVYDLRTYDAHITALHHSLHPNQRYISGNGKLSPQSYGSIWRRDLGLCFRTFYTTFQCEMGVKCAWRHHPLTKAEREWILSSGGYNGRAFLENLSKRWAVPDVPVPGANMHDMCSRK